MLAFHLVTTQEKHYYQPRVFKSVSQKCLKPNFSKSVDPMLKKYKVKTHLIKLQAKVLHFHHTQQLMVD